MTATGQADELHQLAGLLVAVHAPLFASLLSVCMDEGDGHLVGGQQSCARCKLRSETASIRNALYPALRSTEPRDEKATLQLYHLMRAAVVRLSRLVHVAAELHAPTILADHGGSRKKCPTCAALAKAWGLLATMRRLISAHGGEQYLPGQLLAYIRPASDEEIEALGWDGPDPLDGPPPGLELADGRVFIPAQDVEGNGQGSLWAIEGDGQVFTLGFRIVEEE